MNSSSSPQPLFSLARRAGDILFLSGFGPIDEQGSVAGATIEEQTVFTMDTIGDVLERESATFADVVRVNVYLLNMGDRERFNTAYARYFAGVPRMPTRRLIGANELFKNILLEIDCIAYLGSGDLAGGQGSSETLKSDSGSI